jgi:hypothetical protein
MFLVMLFTVEITPTVLQAIRSRLQDNPDEVSGSTLKLPNQQHVLRIDSSNSNSKEKE